MVPLLLLVAAIGAGAGAIAGEEERGTLELLLANPVSRTKVVLEKSVALVAEIAGLGFVLWLALLVGALLTSMDISAGHLAAATLSAVLLALAYGAIALLLGAATGEALARDRADRSRRRGRVSRQRPRAPRRRRSTGCRSSRPSTTTPWAIRCAKASRSRTWQCSSQSRSSRRRSRPGSSPGATSLLERRADLEEVLVELDLEVLHVGLIGERELVSEAWALDVDRVIAWRHVEVDQMEDGTLQVTTKVLVMSEFRAKLRALRRSRLRR